MDKIARLPIYINKVYLSENERVILKRSFGEKISNYWLRLEVKSYTDEICNDNVLYTLYGNIKSIFFREVIEDVTAEFSAYKGIVKHYSNLQDLLKYAADNCDIVVKIKPYKKKISRHKKHKELERKFEFWQEAGIEEEYVARQGQSNPVIDKTYKINERY